ncbi:MAG: hypothetical protein AAF799_08310 [Myxococcota bacterium]
MLTLTGATQLGGLSVFRDVIIDGERSVTTPKVHVLGMTPRLVTHADGHPSLWLTRYRGAPGQRERTGAVMTLSLDLAPTEAELEEVREALGADTEIAILQPTSGTVALSVAGSREADDLLRSISGPKLASLSAHNQASFVVDLTADGAALLDAAMEEQLPLLHVAYELTFQHAVNGVLIRAWADLHAASTVLAERAAAEPVDPTMLLSTVRERKLMGLSVEVLDSAVDQPTVDELTEIAQLALNKAVVETLLAPPNEEGIREVQRPPNKRLDLRIRQGMVLEATTAVTGLISMNLPEEAGRIRQVDTDIETRLDVEVHCTVDFESSPIDTVRMVWELPSTGATDSLHFGPDASEARFRTPLGAEPGWRYQVEIWFDGRTEPLRMPWVDTEETVVVLDLDGMGVLDVKLQLQSLALGDFRAASVELEHPALSSGDVALLDGNEPIAQWSRVTAEHPPRPWRSRVAWLHRDDDERVTGEWQEAPVTQRVLTLRPPETTASTSEVLFITVGSFDDIELALCEVRIVGEETGEAFELAHSGRSKSWSHPPDAAWEYRLTLVRPDGSRQTEQWSAGDDPVVVVRDPYMAAVTVVPFRLDAMDNLRMAQVELKPAGPDAGSKLLSFRPGAPESTWTFRSATADDPAYSYRQIFITSDVGVLRGDWVQARSQVLVLSPPTD